VFKAASGRKSHVSIYGDDYPTRDGTCIRDYIHVVDLVAAHLLALRHMQHKKHSQIFNLGNGQGFSVKEVIDAAKKVTGRDFNVKTVARRAGDPAKLIADSYSAQKQLNWNRSHNTIEKIIRDAWQWELKGY
jgi:UDP-glucose 4-epimerase